MAWLLTVRQTTDSSNDDITRNRQWYNYFRFPAISYQCCNNIFVPFDVGHVTLPKGSTRQHSLRNKCHIQHVESQLDALCCRNYYYFRSKWPNSWLPVPNCPQTMYKQISLHLATPEMWIKSLELQWNVSCSQNYYYFRFAAAILNSGHEWLYMFLLSSAVTSLSSKT